jgi:hypothetical protein
MQLTLRQQLSKFGRMLQNELFPVLEEDGDVLTEQHKRFIAALAMVPLNRFVPCAGNWVGRPQRNRCAIASAFLARSVLNLTTTRQLLERLRIDVTLRKLCGWDHIHQIPHEATFSRAFAEFAHTKIAEVTHEFLIRDACANHLVGHISRDSTAITAWERVSSAASNKKAVKAAENKAKKSLSHAKKPRAKRVAKRKLEPEITRIERQKTMTPEAAIAELDTCCSIGVKRTASKEHQYWVGYKLHLDVADGQIPISAAFTSAHVHDSQLAIPLAKRTASRVQYCYELMDSAYDAASIREYIKATGHVPIIDAKAPQNQQTQLPVRRKHKREFTTAEQLRYRERTTVERAFSRLKYEFGARSVRVRGAQKVMAHLMFGVLALTADQLLRLGG